MGKINVLDKHTAELIAAGEVVERPAAVIKELAENSIDAGATALTIEIKNGGISFMRITDNGSGFERDDIKNAFLRHATSKIKLDSDLDCISTLGFRGEALASVCAVSKVELLTRTADDGCGTSYVIEGGEEQSFSDTGCPVGSTIIVRDLFYNTPARMKFLKKDSSEGIACSAVVDRLALSHPEVSVRYIRDNKEELVTPGDGKLLSAIYSVCKREFAKGLLPLDYSINGVRVSGYVSRPENSRSSRGMQYFFINGRYVRTKTAMAALEEAFKGAVMTGKFPACVLHISLNPETIDVNVHPAKIEVRFSNERPLFEAVYYGTKNALSNSKLIPEVAVKPVRPETYSSPIPFKGEQTKLPHTVPTERTSPPIFEPEKTDELKVSSEVSFLNIPPPPAPVLPVASADVLKNEVEYSVSIMCEAEPEPEKEAEKVPEPQFTKPEPIAFKISGECYNTYIIAETEKEIFFIDKHAAHERIIYDRLKAQNQTASQMLLMPQNVNLSKDEYAVLAENLPLLADAGFDIEEFGGNTFMIRAVPSYLDGTDAQSAVEEIAGKLIGKKHDIRPDKQDVIFHSVACRAAIKAGHKSTGDELYSLAAEVLNNNDIRHCPHGRPVLFSMKKSEIEKNFGRI